MNLLKKAKAGYIVTALLYIVLGICLAFFPDRSLETICLIIGIIALAVGVFKIISFLIAGKGSRFFVGLDLISGIFSVIAGAVLIARPTFITNIFPVVIGILVIIDSAFKLQNAFELRSENMKNWWSVLFFAILGIIFGFLLLFNPFKATRVALIFVGISLIIDGIENLWTLFFVKKTIKNAAPLEVDFREVDSHNDSEKGNPSL